MTVAVQTPTISYTENGATTAFPVPYRYDSPADLRAERLLADGSTVVLVNGTDFTATPGPTNAGGTLTLTTAGPSGARLTIFRRTARTQAADYITSGAFTAESHESALDRAMLVAQEQDADLIRALKVPVGEVAVPFGSQALAQAGDLLEFDGAQIAFKPFSLTQVGAAQGAAEDAALRAELAAQSLIATVGAIEAFSYPEGMRRTVAGEAFFLYNRGQLLRYSNGVSSGPLDPTFALPVTPTAPPAPPLLLPGSSWNGTAGSGFAVAPADPTRTTAKPMLRLMTPDYQFFTDELLVGVFAAANNNGSLFDNLGLNKVRFHFEGRSVDVMAPSYQTFDDVNGNPVTYFGWWVSLKRGATDGHARLYVEAFPKDGTMQNRVIGPFQFSPQAVLYDKEIEIAATPAEITGQRYKTLANAFLWMRDNNTLYTNPRITFTEAGNYAFAPPSFGDPGAANGWITVRATAPVVFNTGDAGFGDGVFWVRSNNWRIMGQNITIDFQTFRSFYNSEADGREYWFDGCNLTVSGGRYSLKDRNEVAPGITSKPWLTECNFSNGVVGAQATLARGCTFTNAWRVIFNNARCVVGCRVVDADSTEYTATLNALTVTYGGAEATASIAISGGNNTSGKVVTLKYGATTTTFAIDTASPSGSFYKVSDVVAWINTKPGFTAVTLDDTRRAASLTKTGAASFGAFADTNVKSTTLTLVTAFDIHSDLFMLLPGLPADNIIFWGNSGEDINDMQVFFAQPTGVGARDVLVANNAFAVVDGYNLQSQFQQSISHFVLAHNSVAEQIFTLSTNQGLTLDSYCLVANNVFEGMQWDGAPLSTTAIRNNHLNAGATAPATATGTTIGGTTATLYVDAPNGNFTPQGALVTNLKASLLQRDIISDRRNITAPAGALA